MNSETTKRNYDYIVVGSGAGGGPVAANLAKAGYKVLLLEAGSDESDNIISQVPTFHPVASEDPELRWDFFVKHYTAAARQRKDSKYDQEHKGIFYPRAGTLGGCTVHNAMITVYPSNNDWDKIAEITGDPSWRSDNMRKYFERLERCQYGPGSACQRFIRTITFGVLGNPSRHGYDGWLGTEIADPTLVLPDKKLLKIVVQAGLEVIGEHRGNLLERFIKFVRRVRREFDPNDWRRVQENPAGLAATPLATNQGERNGTRDLVKQVQKDFPQNLTIQTNALVTRVLFDDDNKAIGVEYLAGKKLYRADRDANQINQDAGTRREVYVKREVILSGGAFNTPQMLMLSGVGPKEELAKHKIDVRVDLPGVGRNLQDRYEVTVVSEMKGDFGLLDGATFSASEHDPFFVEWEKYREGVYTTNGVLIGIIRRSKQQRPDPDLYIFGIPGFFKGYFPGYHQAHIADRNFFTWAILKGHTRNTAGRVTLKSNDPRDVPDINFRYFDDDSKVDKLAWAEDLDSVVEGVEFVRRMNRQPDLAELIDKEYVPGQDVISEEQIREHVKNEAWGHHASCSCKIGADDDELAVLDSKFRVRGTKNLRVVDASVFPHIPGLFIVSAVYMIGEKASVDILADAK